MDGDADGALAVGCGTCSSSILRYITAPDYSPVARQYARSRPRYPPELFEFLGSLVDRRQLAWDCATGSGQAAVRLADHFGRVIATDHSMAQLQHATVHPRVEYREASAEHSGLEQASVDLITAAAAIHWFDLEAFFAEVRRVLHPGGVLAVWTYHVAHVEPPFGDLFGRLYEIMRASFPEGAALVDARYEPLALPGTPLPSRRFVATARWSLDQMLAFIETWSGTIRHVAEHGRGLLEQVRPELEEVWGQADTVRLVRWPLYLRVSRP